LSAAFHLDGSGSLGAISTGHSAPATNEVKIVFGSNGARYIEYGDKLVLAQADGDAFLATTSAVSYLIVLEKDRENNTVTFAPYNVSDVLVAGADVVTDLVRTENLLSHVYRAGTTTNINQGNGFAGVEMNNVAEIMPGLPSLTANDGRLMHGMTMSGITSGTKSDAGGQAIDISHIQKGLDKLKTITGEGTFKYKQLLSAPETLAAFIESQETDRRLINISDNKRGQKGFGYMHNTGSDGYSPFIQKFMMAYMTLICKRPNAILEIENFTV